jgi:uncharacterized alpha-E superfamily protein
MWFGRYAERAESIARELQSTLSLALDGELTPRQCWYPAVIVAGEEAAFRKLAGDEAFSDGEKVQDYLVWDERCGVSLRRTVSAARENARAIREVVSGDAWETINELHLWMGSPAARIEWRDARYDFYRRVRSGTQLLLGLLRSTMLHDTALDFIWLGVLLERSGQTARLLDVHHHAVGKGAGSPHEVVETALWLGLLRACSGVEPFLKAYAGRVSGAAVAHFLLSEDRFPRSIAYCVHASYDRLCGIRPPGDDRLPGGQSLARLRALDEWVHALPANPGSPDAVHAALTHVVDEIAAICDTIGVELLGYAPPASASPPVAEA